MNKEKAKITSILNKLEDKYANVEVLYKGNSVYGDVSITKIDKNPRRKTCLSCRMYVKEYGQGKSEFLENCKDKVTAISISRGSEKVIEGWVHNKGCIDRLIQSYKNLQSNYNFREKKKREDVEKTRKIIDQLEKLERFNGF